jgi:hypothetical protein
LSESPGRENGCTDQGRKKIAAGWAGVMWMNMTALMVMVAMMTVVAHGIPPRAKWRQDSMSASIAATIERGRKSSSVFHHRLPTQEYCHATCKFWYEPPKRL